MSERTEGWYWPAEARKAHWFVRGRSLCGRWGKVMGYETPSTPAPKCVVCSRKLEKRLVDAGGES